MNNSPQAQQPWNCNKCGKFATSQPRRLPDGWEMERHDLLLVLCDECKEDK